jgi:hypothetical protein
MVTMEFALTGNATLAWIRGWFERKANCYCDIQFFSGEREISSIDEEEIIAFEVPDLRMTMRERKEKEWIPTHDCFLWKMRL